MLYPGDRVKDYEVIAPLRSGGMALLYLARRRGVGGFSRLVALKLVHPHLMRDEAITKLFLQEARISANVAHPNVVSVEEIGPTGSSYFIAMEYVHGVSLAELLASLRERRLRMSPKLCVWLTAQMAEALHAVHEATGETGVPLQIVHRDVSPQNVLVGHTGHVKLIDFGIAKSCSRGYQSVGTGPAVLGKLGYMAPEQLRSEPADRRSDVYALGVMLWEMLAARRLYRCKAVDDERDWTLRESPVPPGKFTTFSTPALDRVVVKAIACAREQRYGTALEFRAALLHAEPNAAQVDAPMFAALMRTMLGSKLEQLRARLPSEVSMELARDAEATTARASSVEGLTAHIGSSDDVGSSDRLDQVDEGADEPTSIAESPTTEVSRLEVLPLASDGVTLEPQSSGELETGPTLLYDSSRLLTEPSPTFLVHTARPMRGPQLWMLRAAIGMVCLAVGIAAGALVSGFGPRSKSSAYASGNIIAVPASRPAPLASRAEVEVRPAADSAGSGPAAAAAGSGAGSPAAADSNGAGPAATQIVDVRVESNERVQQAGAQRLRASGVPRRGAASTKVGAAGTKAGAASAKAGAASTKAGAAGAKAAAGAKVGATGAKAGAAGAKAGVAGAKVGAFRAAKLSKGSSAGGRKSKSPMSRKLKNAVR